MILIYFLIFCLSFVIRYRDTGFPNSICFNSKSFPSSWKHKQGDSNPNICNQMMLWLPKWIYLRAEIWLLCPRSLLSFYNIIFFYGFIFTFPFSFFLKLSKQSLFCQEKKKRFKSSSNWAQGFATNLTYCFLTRSILG